MKTQIQEQKKSMFWKREVQVSIVIFINGADTGQLVSDIAETDLHCFENRKSVELVVLKQMISFIATKEIGEFWNILYKPTCEIL